MTTQEILQRLEADLCYHLDSDVYLPTKNELTQLHSLGRRKEDFKQFISTRCCQALMEINQNETRR